MTDTALPADLALTVSRALEEDIGSGDITAALIPAETQATAHIYSRETAVLCGQPWVREVLNQVDPTVDVSWLINEGELLAANQHIATLKGSARSLLTAERCMLNFLQTLSGTATVSHQYASQVSHTRVRLLDTRKTLPGLRTAQKYAVRIGGCFNHRMGLYDAFLIKENHISACGSLSQAVERARELSPDKLVEVEVETLEQLREALQSNPDTVMLDNFDLAMMREAVTLTAGRVKLEVSGGVNQQTLVPIAETGVDFISIGALTKDCRAVDLSMLFV